MFLLDYEDSNQARSDCRVSIRELCQIKPKQITAAPAAMRCSELPISTKDRFSAFIDHSSPCSLDLFSILTEHAKRGKAPYMHDAAENNSSREQKNGNFRLV